MCINKTRSFAFWLAVIVLAFAGCSTAYKSLVVTTPDLAHTADGVYRGSYHVKGTPNSAMVEVTVQGGKITDIKIVKRICSWIGKKADRITDAVIKAQSLNVDVVSGATSSSKAILKAAENALNGKPEKREN
jgi:uncharacterized protein with FMN-binding domain